MAKLVSIVMPAYNVSGYVDEAFNSVYGQGWPALELIVVDDGSTDETLKHLEAAQKAWTDPGRRLEILSQGNRGAGAARNTGLNRAAGEYVVFMDADDRLHSNLVDRMVKLLNENTDVDLVFPCHRYVDAHGDPTGFSSKFRTSRFSAIDLMIENPIHSATGVAVRREAAILAGAFDPALPACIDLDLWVRIGQMRPENIMAANVVLADYRKREGQITEDWRRMETGWNAVYEKFRQSDRALTRQESRMSRARQTLFWSSLAYEAGNYRDARRLIAEAWLCDPRFATRTPLAWVRALSCLASLLPSRAHGALRDGFNRIGRQKG